MSTDHDLSGLIGGPGVPRALGLHAGRYLRVWSRQPASYLTALVVPLIYLYITHELFGGFIRTLTGTLDANHITMVVAVSWAFVLAVSGSGAMLAERRAGLHDRFDTLPVGRARTGRSPQGVALYARVLAELLLCALMMVLVETVSAWTTGFTLWSQAPTTLVAVTVLAAAAASCTGVLVSVAINSPQGQVGVIPVIIVFMIVNTGILPADLFAPSLRGFAAHTPVSGVVSLMDATLGSGATPGRWALVLAWFGGIVVLGLLGIQAITRRRRA